MRVFALSDIHVDYEANARWVESLSRSDYRDDVLLLAGDVSDSVVLLERCLRQFADRFKHLLFVPGNHELWVVRDGACSDSFDKFEMVCEIARRSGASMAPFRHGQLTIVPLLGWYDYSFGEPDLALLQTWMDFHACRWPGAWTSYDVTSHFLQMNRYQRRTPDEIIISFSHFVPRIDVMPNFIPLQHRGIFPVLGTHRLEQQVRELGSAIHVYGHSHVNRCVQLDGTAYVNNAFAYPREVHLSQKALLCLYDCP
ncbi:metallophosphoesterase [Variovorax sp. NFACC27]|uniref:metallophosphoesterase family protein n=1 Tax=unclassified Variovorax TaxID=663243 RepID=UPI0008976D5F|nr:metallophosphoesterase [Variovorax sp. YR750]SEF29792.1 Calcineurin-like phosphoesterase [Variovorax sp. NFACC28]SEG86054.1 Calcineurin-like phosphoesterase [Variovorax sp. NFACC29]SFD22825.1 Calcineurin-like phosphoesterase [Variovorax sp. NFACC26]SFG29647.1 Calcineurin-like phosphoesterase [Variovorax sp. NFACC27]SEM52372.1 Calcineurin-like phosphoesterase [Variovorax sp. YR750]